KYQEAMQHLEETDALVQAELAKIDCDNCKLTSTLHEAHDLLGKMMDNSKRLSEHEQNILKWLMLDHNFHCTEEANRDLEQLQRDIQALSEEITAKTSEAQRI